MKTSVASLARTNIGCVAVLMGMMGIVTEAAAVGESNAGLAGKRGLSPIILMFIPDMPNAPPQNVPVMIAQANQAQPDDVKTMRTMGVCYPVPNDNYSAENGLVPTMDAQAYLRMYEHRKVQNSAIITILQQPKHGTLRLLTEADRGTLFDSSAGPVDPADGAYVYLPEKGYLGKDSTTVLVEIGGVKVKVVYYFQAIESPLGNTGWEDLCSETGLRWKISSTIDPNGNSTLFAIDYLSPIANDTGTPSTDPAALVSALGASVQSSLAVDPTSVTFNIADLPAGAVGQTIGTNITLDTNAAGYNWFIDNTPSDNSEYLPTSNPYEWVAKAGSAAEGKMDMLSVLLHEYGHALGIDHSADGHDYMSTTLTPGVRRMPSAEELALMQQLIGVAKGEMIATSTPTLTLPLQGGGGQDVPLPIPLGAGFGMAFLGRLRNSRYGGTSIDVVGAPTITQYAVAANATFTNLNTPAGWNSQGSVDIINGTATLNEVSTSQTRLSQVFMLNERDRYLSFTLSGAALDNLTGAPDDAFEVALLDANTGLSLLGNDGLTRTDAIINLQGDGTQRTANCVTCINNADGSRTYRVDLTGIAAGTAVNLSFDLLGFGASNSQVTLSDIRVSGLPQLHDDVASLAEDNLLSFDPFAQADAQLRPLLASHIVDGPTHGALAMNADGTFSYTPDLDYFGADSFSYRLSDGPLDSNLATVSLTVTPVNDAPVVADVALTTAEDTALVIALGAYASDVDSTMLTPQIVTGPAHGVLLANADGTYSYTPDANYNGADSFTYKVNDGALDSNIATVTLAITSVNDAPQGLSTIVTTLEDTDYVFQLVDFGYSDALDAGSNTGANNFSAVTISSLPLVGTLTNNGIDVVAGQSISVADIAFGLLKFAPAYNANGAGYASFTFQVQDDGGIVNGGVDRDPDAKTITLDVTPVNDAPVAVSATVTGLEDTPYIFYWNDFRVSDVDSVDLAITIDTLPVDGLLQHYDGIQWTVVLAGQRITKADIDAGYLCFGPDANESGFDGYGTAGTGNRLQDYASFTYQADDGFLSSAVASMTIDIVPLADTPALMLSAATDEYGATATRFHTSWETAANYSPVFTILPQSELEGWNVVRETGDTGQQTFILWSSGDKMKDANNTNRIVTAAPNNGNNWLEIGNAMGLGHQTYGIERTVDTRAGVTYNLSLDYAGRLGYGIDFTCIGIYVDGVQIGTHASTSPNTALNWEALSFSFIGNGTSQLRVGTPCPRGD